MSSLRLSAGEVYYELSGPEQGPQVVLVHGLATPSFIWDSTVPALVAAGFRVLRFDLYGRGRTSKPRIRYDLQLFLGQLRELLAALQISRPIRLVGLSMGGAIATAFTAEGSHEIASLSLISPAGLSQKIPLKLRLVQLPRFGDALFRLIGKSALVGGLRRNFHKPARYAGFRQKFLRQTADRGFLPAILSTLRHTNLFDLGDAYRTVGAQQMPVQLIWGVEDQIVPFANSERMQALIPRLELFPVPEAGHIAHYECPDIVNPRLVRFLEGVPVTES